MDSKEFLDALNLVAKEKGIDKEVVFEAIEASLVSACKKNFGTSQNIKVVIDRESGNVACYAQKTVASPVEDPQLEISLEMARVLNPNYVVGDVVDLEVTPKDFGRISAQTAKQVVVQKFREAYRERNAEMLSCRCARLMRFFPQTNRFPANSITSWIALRYMYWR